jgi:hypothetical protein
VVYGAAGLLAYRELLSERDGQQENLEKLFIINAGLENIKNSLLYDRDTIAVHARELGYGGKDQRFVRIVGLRETGNNQTRPGEIVRARRPEYAEDRMLKIIALCAGAAVFAFFLVLDILKPR